MLAFSTVMSTVFGLVLAASAAVFYWVSVCFGFWHITLASDPRDFPRTFRSKRRKTQFELTYPCSGPRGRLWLVLALSIHLLRVLAIRNAMGHSCLQQSDIRKDDLVLWSALGVPAI